MTDARRLRSFVERIESLEKEIKDRNNDKRDVYGEAKDADFDPQAVKDLVAYRRNPTKAEKRSDKFDEYFGLLHSGEPNNAPAGSSGPTEGHLTKSSRARARDEKTEGRSNAGPAHSAPLAATVRDDRGNPVADTDSDALAINQPPAPSQDSERAAEVAPSVASAAPIRESDVFNDIRGSFLDRSLRV